MEYIIGIVIMLAIGAALSRWLPASYKKWVWCYWTVIVFVLMYNIVFAPYRLMRVVDAVKNIGMI